MNNGGGPLPSTSMETAEARGFGSELWGMHPVDTPTLCAYLAVGFLGGRHRGDDGVRVIGDIIWITFI
jgi:hypothetical protein